MEMNVYRVKVNGETYGTRIQSKTAYTPFDAMDYVISRMPWRHKEDASNASVMILDGTKRTWNYEKNIYDEFTEI